MRVDHADVVVVGGGAAGLSAALAAVESFAAAGREDAVVALVSKVYPMRSHTVAAEGGAAGVVPGGVDTAEQHVADTLAGGAGLGHDDAVRFVVDRAPAELARMERLGMPWSRADDGAPAVRRFGGMTNPRTWFAADKTGFHLLHTLFQTSLREPAIRRYDEHVVLDLLLTPAPPVVEPVETTPATPLPVVEPVETTRRPAPAAAPLPVVEPVETTPPSAPAPPVVEHAETTPTSAPLPVVEPVETTRPRRARGVVAYDQQRGEPVTLLAPAVVLATGGYARAWGTSTNAGIVTGDGLSMALRAGLPLRDLEMVQVHPTCLPGSGILITEAARGEGGVLLDADGARYLADYGLGPETPVGEPVARRMELGPRDKLSQAFWHADRAGRTIPTRDGGVVHLDLRHLGKATIDERLPLVAGLARRFAGVDPVTAPIPVRPAAHYTMGGIVTTPQGQVLDAAGAAVTGLFAAGECASTGLHGANRLGSNSLVETLVVGRAAGALAATLPATPASSATPPLSDARKAGDQRASDNPGGADGASREQARIVEQARGLAERWLAMRGRGTESPAAIRRELGAVLDAEVGIFRDADGLARAAAVLDDLAERYRDVRVADTAAVFNTDWTQALELGAMLDVARGAVAAAIGRTESRGAHQRLDHPQTDDVARHSLVTLDPSGAITVTWPPAVEPVETTPATRPAAVEPPPVVEPVETTPATRPARTPEALP